MLVIIPNLVLISPKLYYPPFSLSMHLPSPILGLGLGLGFKVWGLKLGLRLGLRV